MEDQKLTLAHPLVQAAKERFEKGRHRKVKLNFEELFGLFSSNNFSGEEIALKAKVTRESIRLIRDKYFRSILGDKSGCDLRRDRAVTSHRAKAFDSETLSIIAQKARSFGVEVTGRINVYGHEIYTHLTSLLMNGHVCSVYQPENSLLVSAGNNRKYTGVMLSRRKLLEAKMMVVYIKPSEFLERTFVLPSQVVLDAYFKHPQRKQVRIYLPTKKLSIYRNCKPRIDWWQYQDRWDLIPPKAEAPKL